MTRAAVLAFVVAFSLIAQVNTGSVVGYVLDPSGRAISKATVALKSASKAFTRTSTSDNSGFYDFDALPPGDYSLTVSAQGFAAANARPVHVEVDQRIQIDLRTSLPRHGERVLVRDTPVPDIQPDSSEIGQTVSQNLIEGLPLNERDFLQLALLVPGVAPPVEGSQLSTRGTFAMHANGGREEFNDFLLDGVDNNDTDTRGYTLQPSVDAIQEFKISTSTYSAEYGVGAAGQVSIVTRSGSNEFHGALYDYLRNRDLDARNFFDGREKPQFQRNQFGGALGGPVRRESTFFFASYEGLQQKQGLTQLGTVPTLAVRSGNLSSVGGATDPFTGQPFSGGIIPASRISPYAHDILALFPAPNLPGSSGNYLSNPLGTDRQNEAVVRLDQRFSNSSQLTLRYAYGWQNLFEPFAENQTELPGFGDYVHDRGHNALISYQKIFGPRVMNTLMLGFNRTIRQIVVQNDNVNVNSLWGVSYMPADPRDFGFPGISVNGYSRVGDVASLPIDRADNTYQAGDNLVLIRGAHSIKIGGGVRDLQLNGYVEVYSRGQIDFTGALSGSGIGDLLLGFPALDIKSQYSGPQTLRSQSWNGYVQDDWKVARNLTLNVGFRYEYETRPVDPTNRMSTFDFQTGTTVQVGTNGIPRSGVYPWSGAFQPRVGFAWGLSESTVVRGGYGIYYDSGMFVVNSSLYFNPPYFTISVYFPTATSLITLANPFASTNGLVPPAALSFLDPNFKPGYAQDWNFNLQKEFHNIGAFSLAYVGSKGTHLPRSLDVNQPSSPGPAPIYTRAPYPTYSNMLMTESGGDSEYESLQFSFNRHLSARLSMIAAYTFSKSIDDTSAFLPTTADQNFPQDSHNYHLERALSSYDMPNRGTAAFVYRIPGSSPWTRNFEFSGIITAQSGQPFTPEITFDNSNTGNTGGNFGVDRPNVVGNASLAHPSPQEWFNVNAFAVPPPYTWGDAGRNILRSPGLVTADLSLRRTFSLREGLNLTAEVESFNALNRANFNLPDAFVDQPLTFGKIFSAKDPRQIQFALRCNF